MKFAKTVWLTSNHRKMKKSLFILLLIGIVIVSGCSSLKSTNSELIKPTKEEVEKFLSKNACDSFITDTSYEIEYNCASHIRLNHYFEGWPFHYFDYIKMNVYDPKCYEQHLYLAIRTKDEGILVYNPMNGEYVDTFDYLQRRMESFMMVVDNLDPRIKSENLILLREMIRIDIEKNKLVMESSG